ncbi:MAG TPA: strawberry notch family protein, partial [Lacipirellulaceae bacterium]|nr:strawberry notch family protein [Lacipirellulaceae bacterium]
MTARHNRNASVPYGHAIGGAEADLSADRWQQQLLFDFDGTEPLKINAPSSIRLSLTSKFALRIADMLESDQSARLDNARIRDLAQEVFGFAAGHARAAYDAAEAGFNLYLDKLRLDLGNVDAAIEWLLAEQARLPLQNRRDQTQIEFQQFSTPPAQAFVLIKAAALRPGMVVLEPSAGTGNIAVLARLAGSHVDTNEIDPRRRELLELQGFRPTAFDAERLDNLLPAEKNYHAIVMNPPFSATGGRVNGHRTMFGARHIEQALRRLKRGGRLVAIVGHGMAMERPTFREWWIEICERYRVRANIGIDGKEYARFGTTFDNRIIVIDHDGPTTDESAIITRSGLSVHAAYEALTTLTEEDVYGRICKYDLRTSESGAAPVLSCGIGGGGESDSGADEFSFGGPSRRRFLAAMGSNHGGPVAHLEPARDGTGRGACRDDSHDHRSRALEDAADARSDAALGSLLAPLDARRNGDDIGKLETSVAPSAIDVEAGTVFANYRVQKAIVRGAHRHPANVVESTAMACVEPPDITYQHHVPVEVIAEGRISDLQLEDVIYSGQATNMILPDGSRKGHWNGDGTGIGKGREIYAFIYDLFDQGCKKHVHISASHQLVVDAERDRDAVGLPLHIVHQASYKSDDAIFADSGVLFSTYSMLSTDFGGEQRRFKQLTDWLGQDFAGVIAFDEAHLMKNAAATPHGGKSTVDHGTLRGNMGITLQRLFPMARVRYFSATGATEARHMAPYERLGLWGSGAPFADFSAFLVAMERGGVAAMEMLCRDLKSVGTYLSRTISYGPTRLADGSNVPNSAVEYGPLLHRLTDDERRQYNEIADLWSELLLAFESGEKNACQGRNANRYAQFYSAQQRFFLQLLMTYTLPDMIPAIERDLSEGRSVVLSLFNTGEAQTERKVRAARAEGLELSELDATPREMIVQLIEKQFPIYQYQEQTDPVTGNVIRVRIEDAAGNPEINRENERRQRELLEKVADLDFPQNPLDGLVARFGVGNVAEISGRMHRFEQGKYVRRKLKGVPRRQLNEYETRLFQDGRKRIAVISGAGATGISVHADMDAGNQKRRVFYAFQLSWSADQQ